MLFRKQSGLTGIAEEKIGPANFFRGSIECFCDGFFDEPLLEADAEVARENFHEELCFERRSLSHQLDHQWKFCGGSARGLQPGETVCDDLQGEESRCGRISSMAQHFKSSFPEIAVLEIDVMKVIG